MDGDVVPVSEIRQDGGVAFRVVAAENIQRLVREDDAEAEGVVRPVALIKRDAAFRTGLFQQDREIETGRTAAKDGDFQVCCHLEPRPLPLCHSRRNIF